MENGQKVHLCIEKMTINNQNEYPMVISVPPTFIIIIPSKHQSIFNYNIACQVRRHVKVLNNTVYDSDPYFPYNLQKLSKVIIYFKKDS